MLINNDNIMVLEHPKKKQVKTLEDIKVEFETLFKPITRTHTVETVVEIDHRMHCEWCGKEANTLIWETAEAGQFADMKLCRECDKVLVIRPKQELPAEWKEELRTLNDGEVAVLTEKECLKYFGRAFRNLRKALWRKYDWSGYELFCHKNGYDIVIIPNKK